MPPEPPPFPYVEVEIVRPTEEQRQAVLAQINQFAPGWHATPAYLIMKPVYGLIVTLDRIEQDESGFDLILRVEESIIAPANFDQNEPMRLSCCWNQPYLSLGAAEICAAYGFRLLFGAEGVQNVRKVAATAPSYMARVRQRPSPEMLSSCFRPYFQFPEEPPAAPPPAL